MEQTNPGIGRPGVIWFVVLAVWAGAMALASPWDLELSLAVAAVSGTCFTDFIQDWGTMSSGLFYLAAVVYLMAPSLRRRSETMQILAVTLLTMAILHPLVITTAIKLAWGRLRFMQLGGDLTLFTPFYMPNEPGAGTSFPSGHVATACTFSPLVIRLWESRRRGVAIALGLFTAAWTLTVAWGRIAGGYHYFTDTLFSIGLSALLAPFVARWGLRIWQRWYRESG